MDSGMLELIIARAGRLVKLDQAIELLFKGRFERITVEVNLSCLLAPDANIDIEDKKIPNLWQVFEY